MTTADTFTEHRFSAPDGLRLYARVYGEDSRGALPVVCLPGLSRNTRDFHELALHLSSRARVRRRVVSFDYRGRGRSDHDSDWRNYNLVTETNDVVAGLSALGVEHAAFIGTSRGGLIIHLLAGIRPAALKAVVLNDVGPVVDGAGLAQIFGFLKGSPRLSTFDDASIVLKSAHERAFPALSDPDWTRMAHAIYRDENGRPVPDFDPKLLKTFEIIDLGKPLPTLWPQFAGLTHLPMLAIRGVNSKLLSNQTLDAMRARHPGIETITVPGQGHAPLLETGDLPERIEKFLERADRPR